MRAKVFSDDKNTVEILKGMMTRFGFETIETLSCDDLYDANPADFNEVAMLVDMDHNRHLGKLWEYSGYVSILFFGERLSPEVKKGYTPPKGMIQYLRKPFIEPVFRKSMSFILSQDALTELDIGDHQKPPLDDNEKDDLKKLIVKFIGYKNKLSRCLKANKDQLKQSFQKGEIDLASFPLKKVLLLKQNEMQRRTILSHLTEMSVLEVIQSEFGLDTWQMVKKTDDIDLLILDWGITDISGAGLYNRIRANPKFRKIPMVISIKADDKTDRRFLLDDLFTKVVEYMAPKKELKKAVHDCVLDAKLASYVNEDTYQLLMQAIIDKLPFKGLAKEARKLFHLTLRTVGERFIKENKLHLAEKSFKLAWQMGDETPAVLTGMAKVYHCQKRHQKAARILGKIDILAPGDLQRLCLQAEVNLWLHHFNDALSLFQKALVIDPQCKKAIAGRNILIQMSKTKNDSKDLDVLKMGSPLNMTAIYKVRQGRFKEALTYYLSAYSLVYTDLDRAKILFNIGLCYLRAGKKDQAMLAFEKSCDESNGQFKKAQKYIDQAFSESDDDFEDLAEFEEESIAP